MSYLEQDRRVELKLFGLNGDIPQTLPSGGRLIVHRDGRQGWIIQSPLSANETWSTAFERFVASLGGEEVLSELIDRLDPQRKIAAIFAPFDSPYQENNGFTAATVQLLARIGLELDVVPLDFDPRNPTHLADGYE